MNFVSLFGKSGLLSEKTFHYELTSKMAEKYVQGFESWIENLQVELIIFAD